MTRIIRKQELIQITGLSYATLWRRERAGDFPQRLRLGPHAVGWRLDEIEDWMASRPRVETH